MANSKSIAFGNDATSDLIMPDADAVSAQLMVKAKNDGAPAAGDDIGVHLLISTGDPDADPDTTNEFTTVGHADVKATLETDVEDPAISNAISIPLPMTGGYKVYCKNLSAGRAITVSGQVVEQDVGGNITKRQVAWT